MRRRGLAASFVPPISVVLAKQKDTYIRGLTKFREDRVVEWIATFTASTAAAAQLAIRYAGRVRHLQEQGRARMREKSNPRSDAAAWAIIDTLPAHLIIAVPLALLLTGRTKPAVTNAIDQLQRVGTLLPLSASKRNRQWEAQGLLDLIVGLEAGAG
ncbi:MAG TPA: hypothetical protein VK821_13165 [Dehalococcoidia bacterium]|nr:hypothetical protein [Dehalococcoidia bacterium]